MCLHWDNFYSSILMRGMLINWQDSCRSLLFSRKKKSSLYVIIISSLAHNTILSSGTQLWWKKTQELKISLVIPQSQFWFCTTRMKIPPPLIKITYLITPLYFEIFFYFFSIYFFYLFHFSKQCIIQLLEAFKTQWKTEHYCTIYFWITVMHILSSLENSN